MQKVCVRTRPPSHLQTGAKQRAIGDRYKQGIILE